MQVCVVLELLATSPCAAGSTATLSTATYAVITTAAMGLHLPIILTPFARATGMRLLVLAHEQERFEGLVQRKHKVVAKFRFKIEVSGFADSAKDEFGLGPVWSGTAVHVILCMVAGFVRRPTRRLTSNVASRLGTFKRFQMEDGP